MNDIIDGREGRKSIALLEALYKSDATNNETKFSFGAI